jgi:hypothetical protein
MPNGAAANQPALQQQAIGSLLTETASVAGPLAQPFIEAGQPQHAVAALAPLLNRLDQ